MVSMYYYNIQPNTIGSFGWDEWKNPLFAIRPPKDIAKM